jgi:hypothetical protein
MGDASLGALSQTRMRNPCALTLDPCALHHAGLQEGAGGPSGGHLGLVLDLVLPQASRLR